MLVLQGFNHYTDTRKSKRTATVADLSLFVRLPSLSPATVAVQDSPRMPESRTLWQGYPALAYWLPPGKLGDMLSLLHLEGRTYRMAVHLQM